MIAATSYIVFFLCISFLTAVFNRRINMSGAQKKIVYTIFVISLATVAYHMNPPRTWDLSRNYMLLNIIRTSGLDFFQFVFGGRATYIADGYRSLTFYNIYRYIFVKIFNNNAWYQTITATIVYMIQFYIIYDYEKEKRENVSIALILLLSFAFLPFVYVTSGIRNALAVSIMGLAVYWYLYRKQIIKPIILVIISVTIHPSVLIALPFAFLSKREVGIKGIAWVAIASVGFQLLATVFSISGILFLQQIGKSYLHYSGSGQYRGGRGNLYGILILTVIFILYFLWNRKNIQSRTEENEVDTFLMLLLVYMAGNFLNYDLVLRPGYIVGIFSPFLTNRMMNSYTSKNVRLVLNVLIILSGIYVNYKCFQILIEAF